MTDPSLSAIFRRGFARASLALIAAGVLFAGCEKEPPKPPPAPPPAPAPPPPPEPVDVEALLQEKGADPRVQFAGRAAPVSRELAEAVIDLADALAKGDAETLRPLLDRSAQAVLDDLTATGEWDAETGKIEAVRVVSLTGAQQESPSSSTVTIAVQDPRGAYLLGWSAVRSGDTWLFKNAPAQGDVRPRASAFDGVVASAGPAPSAANNDEDADDYAGPSEDAPATPDEPEERPGGPIRKNTPGGPITIPGTGGIN